jgi:hypothetical protein
MYRNLQIGGQSFRKNIWIYNWPPRENIRKNVSDTGQSILGNIIRTINQSFTK